MSGFQVKTFQLKTEKLKKGCEFKFAYLTDLHNREFGTGNIDLIHAVKSLRPDVILAGGDMLIGNSRLSFWPAQHLVKELTRIAPVYYSNGNHESRMRLIKGIYGDMYERYTEPLKEAGVHFLENDSAHIMIDDENEIVVCGYEMDLSYYEKFILPKYDLTDLTDKLGHIEDSSKYHILMAHNPVYFHDYAAWGADLTLSGHLHGGIIRLPFVGGVITPQAKIFPGYDRGIYEENGHHMILSPGLGEHTVPIRINNPRWLISITLEGIG